MRWLFSLTYKYRIGMARKDASTNCGLQPATKAMDNDPKAIFVFNSLLFFKHDNHRFSPRKVNIIPVAIGKE